MCITRPRPVTPPQTFTDAEIVVLRQQQSQAVADARAESERRGGHPVHPRILAARAAGKTV